MKYLLQFAITSCQTWHYLLKYVTIFFTLCNNYRIDRGQRPGTCNTGPVTKDIGPTIRNAGCDN